MSEETPTYNTTAVPATNGDAPPPKRNGSRGMIPGTWLNREVRIEYVDAAGKPVTSSGVLLDYFGFGLALNLAGGRVLLSWDRLVMLELQAD